MPETDVTPEQIAALVSGPELAVFRRKFARFMAARRKCEAAGFGTSRLVVDVHAGRAFCTVEIVEKEPE